MMRSIRRKGSEGTAEVHYSAPKADMVISLTAERGARPE
jgi:hypothetical protein